MVDDNHNNDLESFGEEEFLAAESDYERDNTPPKQNLKEIWEQNPSLKMFAIVAGIGVFLIAFMVLGSGGSSNKPKDSDRSIVRQTADVSHVPGTTELPPAYEEALRQANERSAEMAAATGGSAIPTPIARPTERIEAPVQTEKADPLAEWRREAEQRRLEREKLEEERRRQAEEQRRITLPEPVRVAAPTPVQPQNPPLPTGPTPDQIQQIAQGLQQQMQTILETQIPKESVVVSMNIQPGYKMEKYFPPEPPPPGATPVSANNPMGGMGANKPTLPLIPAGSIAYAQIITEANSDVPGPVLAEVASGPLAGGRAIGSFQVAEKHLVVQFNRIVKDGIEYPVQAYALDPGTTLPGVVSDVNNHYFTRVFLPAAAKFISGFAEAATQKDTQVVVSNGTVVSESSNELDTEEQLLKGAKEAGQKLSQIVDEGARRPRTIRIFAGTRVGILFLNSVADPNAATHPQMPQSVFNPGGQQAAFGGGQFTFGGGPTTGQSGNPGYVAAPGARPYPMITEATRPVR